MIGIDELIEDGLLDKADKPKKVPVAAADFVAVCCCVHYCNLYLYTAASCHSFGGTP